MTAGPRRFPRSVFDHGEEPDPRFTLANERTFLAWIRTALAFIAGGIALEAVSLPLHPWTLVACAWILLVTGVCLPAAAWLHWSRAERAIRLGESLPAPFLSAPVAVAVSAVGVLVLVGLVLGP